MRREAHLRLLIRKARVRRAEIDIRHNAVIIPMSALDDDKRPLLNVLWRNREPHAEIFLESATN